MVRALTGEGVSISSGGDASRAVAFLELGGREHQVWFESSGEELGKETDFLVPLALFPAMVSGSHLELGEGISLRLLSAVPKVQEIFRHWGAESWGGKYEDLRRVPLEAGARDGPVEHARGVACFFSGGTDSFYSLLRHRDEVTHLVFVHGFDIPLANRELRAKASRMAREVARELGKTLVEVETNVRSFSDPLVGWEKYHGAALASVALLFQHRFRRVIFAASDTYAALLPWGSHPLLDPLWSTELTDIEHDGCETPLAEKISYLSESDLAMRWLRVCYKNEGDAYNCGHCRKCVGARIRLRAVGAEGRCETLPGELDLEEVENLDLSSCDETVRIIFRQDLRALERRGTDPALALALAKAIDRGSGVKVSHAARVKRRRLHRRLSRVREELERTRAQLGSAREVIGRARVKNRELAAKNRELAGRYSGWHYRVAGKVVGMFRWIAGVRELVRRGSSNERSGA